MLIKRKGKPAEEFNGMNSKERPYDGYEAIKNFSLMNKQISDTFKKETDEFKDHEDMQEDNAK